MASRSYCHNTRPPKHWDKVPDDHKCEICKFTKADGVRFGCWYNPLGLYIRKVCNSCRKRAKMPKAVSIQDKIKRYFNENY